MPLLNNLLTILTWIVTNIPFILGFFLVLIFLVVIHEFGHFFVAKWFGIKVLEFGFGIPPKAWGKKVGETLVSINWLPLGGFVRLLGEDESDPEVLNNKRSFAAQHVWKRIAVVVAGIFINILFAWLIFWGILLSTGFKDQFPLLNDFKFIGVEQRNEDLIFVSGVQKDTPADTAGFKPGDRISKINDQNINSVEQVQKLIAQSAGKQLSVTLSDQSNRNQRSLEVTPRENPPQGQGPLGIGLDSQKVAYIEYTKPWQKLLSGPLHGINYAWYSISVFSDSISKAYEQKDANKALDNATGLIGVAYVSKIIVETQPLVETLRLIGLISLTLGVMNLLPIPALDGGRLFFLLIEAITRKKLPANIEAGIHTVGMMMLIALMFYITWNDFRRFILPFLG